MDNLRVNGHIFFMQKGTQPSQTCSEGYTFPATALYRGVSLYFGSINSTKLEASWLVLALRAFYFPSGMGLYFYSRRNQWISQGLPNCLQQRREFLPQPRVFHLKELEPKECKNWPCPCSMVFQFCHVILEHQMTFDWCISVVWV